jgi:L-threonylcarbamoyladenylate synthase
MSGISTEYLDAGPQGTPRAARILREGGLVAFATETVYGLGADAGNGAAVARIFAAKGRPQFNPLIVHVADRQAAQGLACFCEDAERLAAAFWPGALTLVLPLCAGAALSGLVSAGLGTVGIRVPAHPAARALLTEFGGPVAAPSANPSGKISPTTAAHVAAGLDGRIDAILDAGPCMVGVESTIIGFGPRGPVLLRSGGVPEAAIRACTGRLEVPDVTDAGAAPTAPGQLASHYAPRAAMRLNARTRRAGEVRLGFGPGIEPVGDADLNLSESGDMIEAAANLYRHLHTLDATGAAMIAVAPVPETGLGVAINDRLKRAAAPR